MLIALLSDALHHNGELWSASRYIDSKGRGNWWDNESSHGFITAYNWMRHLGVTPDISKIGRRTL